MRLVLSPASSRLVPSGSARVYEEGIILVDIHLHPTVVTTHIPIRGDDRQPYRQQKRKLLFIGKYLFIRLTRLRQIFGSTVTSTECTGRQLVELNVQEISHVDERVFYGL